MIANEKSLSKNKIKKVPILQIESSSDYPINPISLIQNYLHMSKTNLSILFLTLTAGWILYSSIDSHHGEVSKLYSEWKTEHNVVYQSESENSYRFSIFMKNYEAIQLHNLDPESSYQLGINQFSDLSDQEFVQARLNFWDPSSRTINTATSRDQNISNDVDWVAKGAVTPARNNGQCYAPWAFAATSAIEALYHTKNDQLIGFSEQFLIDCCSATRDICIKGQLGLEQVYNCIALKGIATADQYPYVAKQSDCKVLKGDFKIDGFKRAEGCVQISKELAMNPVSVKVDASNWSRYKSGIFDGCSSTVSINHIVIIVAESSTFWTLKNCWGTTWGEKGFIRIAKGNKCGVCTQGTIPYKQ